MVEKEITIRNKAGIHCRPSGAVITEAEKYPDHTFLLSGPNGKSSLQSILDLLSLGLQCGDKAKLTVEGPEEAVVAEKLAAALEYEYDFR